MDRSLRRPVLAVAAPIAALLVLGSAPPTTITAWTSDTRAAHVQARPGTLVAKANFAVTYWSGGP